MSIASEAAQESVHKPAQFIDRLNRERTGADFEAAFRQAFNKALFDAKGRFDISDHTLREQVLQENSRSAKLAAFARYNLDGDRVHTDAEIAAFARPLSPDAMPFDADCDGAVMADEFFTPVFAKLDHSDVNDDGIYEDSELK